MPSQDRINREARGILVGAQEREDRAAPRKVKARRGRGGAWKPTWRDAALGVVLGTLTGLGLARLGLIGVVPVFRGDHAYGVAAAVGLLLGISRLRSLLWVAAGLTAAAILVVGYTPFVKPLVRECVRQDPLGPAAAVVVLSSDIFPDGEMTGSAQSRYLRGYEIVRQGYAPRLVLTRLYAPKKSYRPAVEAQLDRLRMQVPLFETETVRNTRDEALAVSKLAKEHGWDEVILVSEPSHLRRAGAAFEKVGLKVRCSPSPEMEYDLESLDTPVQRLDAFGDWVRETIGYHTYRRNGWL